ncbi:LOW QUALITY PROTEIN: hypothetical protein TorRG33x02_110360 [Trema orientale]|uniref:Uncharacterized protein n=1 Tax=Trema orientale TaxID=63057 RepID=A0A2P5F5R5_TREOI|nr:LOW QUALITY PROTEIN: hypothetical protein TorRG33x02_110360 [Trema orientale]
MDRLGGFNCIQNQTNGVLALLYYLGDDYGVPTVMS